MAKQRSGLGRGLNALFDEAPQPSRQAPEKKPTSEEVKKDVSQSSSVSSEHKPLQNSSSSQSQGTGKVADVAQKTGTLSVTSTESASGIYISEDALEHAKVVSREARKTPHIPHSLHNRLSVSQTKPSQGGEEQRLSGAAVAGGRSVAGNSEAKNESVRPKPAAQAVPAKPSMEKGDTGVIALDKIQPNPDQPRTNFKQEEINELANSIKKEGLLQPILVRKVGDHYQIIAGERRWQACKTLQMKEIPVRFWKADSDKALELALIENIQRSDLNPIEEAYGYKRLMERKGMTQSEVAQTVSKGRSTIANALRLLDLPEEAQQLLFEEKISAGHARAILSIPTAEGRKTLTKKLMNEKLSVRETESLARLLAGRAQAEEKGSTKRAATPASFKKAARGLTRFFSAPVRVKTVQGKNKIEIQFKDEEELERILSLITAESRKAESEE